MNSLLSVVSFPFIEGWHYSTFDDQTNTCYFGILQDQENHITLPDENPRQISINTNEIGSFVSDTFVTRQSNIYSPYPYVRFENPKNIEHCSIHCYFDTENICDFFFIHHTYCYLGNFNQVSPIGKGHALEKYIQFSK